MVKLSNANNYEITHNTNKSLTLKIALSGNLPIDGKEVINLNQARFKNEELVGCIRNIDAGSIRSVFSIVLTY